MRNTIVMISLLGVLAIAFFTFIYERGDSSLQKEAIAFAVEDTAKIHQIIIRRMIKGEPKVNIYLDRQTDGSWMLNKQYPALMPKIQQLLKVMHLIQVKDVLVDEGLESAEAILQSVHTEVTAIDKNGRIIKAYQVGTETKEATGTLARLMDMDTPYIVEMPGLQGYINTYFPIDSNLWRENLLFRADLATIQRIAISYPDPERSFILSRNTPEASWQILGIEQKLDSNQLAAYLANFQGSIYAESFADQHYPEKKAALIERQPDIEVSIGYFEGEPRVISLFERAENPNNYFGWVSDRDELLTIQHFVFDKFLIDRPTLLGIKGFNKNPAPTL